MKVELNMTEEDKEIIHKITMAHMDKLDLMAGYFHYKIHGEIRAIENNIDYPFDKEK